MLLAPLISDRKGEHLGLFEDARRAGFVRVRVNGTVYELDEVPKLAKYKKHTIEVVVDRVVIRHADDDGGRDRSRLLDSVETALKLGGGIVNVATVPTDDTPAQELTFSEHLACPKCGFSMGEIEP